LREKRRNKSVGERSYLMLWKSSAKDLASWQEEGGDCRGVIWVTADWREREIDIGVKGYSR
jgi:hypothetical protein